MPAFDYLADRRLRDPIPRGEFALENGPASILLADLCDLRGGEFVPPVIFSALMGESLGVQTCPISISASVAALANAVGFVRKSVPEKQMAEPDAAWIVARMAHEECWGRLTMRARPDVPVRSHRSTAEGKYPVAVLVCAAEPPPTAAAVLPNEPQEPPPVRIHGGNITCPVREREGAYNGGGDPTYPDKVLAWREDLILLGAQESHG